MADYLRIAGILLEVLLLFNLIIIAHELGHFLAARWRGLVVEKFGIWFGKPLWKKTIGGVEYSLGSIPAGGFVLTGRGPAGDWLPWSRWRVRASTTVRLCRP